MKRRMHGLLIALLGALGCGAAHSQGSGHGVSPSSAQDAELGALASLFDAAWNAHDPRAMAALFTPDATLVTPTARRVEGTEQLRELFSEPGPTKHTTSTTRFSSVQWLAEDLVLVDGVQRLRGPGVERIGTAEARLVAVLQRTSDGWRFAASRPFVPAGQP